MKPLKIILKTKNEGILLEKWLIYHDAIIGLENIVVLDNESDDEYTKEVYSKYKNLEVIIYKGNINNIHFYNQNKEFYKTFLNKYRFITNLDTDEFLCYYDINGKKFNPFLINEKLNKIEDDKSIATLWMHNTPKKDFIKYNNFDDFIYFELDPLTLSKNLNYGKTIVGTNSQTFKNGHSIIGHNTSSKEQNFFYDNFFTFHFNRFDIKRRIKNNIFLTKARCKEVIGKNFDPSYFDHLITALDDDSINVDTKYLASINRHNYHKLIEIINYFDDIDKHMRSRANFNKNFYFKDNIVQSVINKQDNIREILYNNNQLNSLYDVDFLKNILIYE
jgi:hypothetical protein